MEANPLRIDHKAILDLIPLKASVLDLGCGNGELLYLLIKEKQVRGQGIEIDEQAIYKCVAKGLNVFHDDLDVGLADYEDRSFDYVVLNQSIQQVHHLESVLNDALRVGRKVIVGFPNFAYYRARFQLVFLGKAPTTPSLPFRWYESPNLHFLSISDFVDYCWAKKITIARRVYLGKTGPVTYLPNFRADSGLFVISKSP
ncbi:methionine biosynthesis protein MetW [candidate division KSB3 bacterium]|uniref:Methionine biosynthesis protein MetW n=1 Tax=candidate division KSB3 bacterium TaxID=2044937 RepID=A0A2G6E580_9BACT|nr:MAG: methionine biosynthesis protein MetW [candidate division KSB3 bacterium]PIE29671.1 MAG: methionine biosynthesis protein MetW [candidate division KSB3 bacterium]